VKKEKPAKPIPLAERVITLEDAVKLLQKDVKSMKKMNESSDSFFGGNKTPQGNDPLAWLDKRVDEYAKGKEEEKKKVREMGECTSLEKDHDEYFDKEKKGEQNRKRK
jgi:hypothetical protein